jgi:hypothetical protein
MGDIYDSVVVGFLAVLGVDKEQEGFQDAPAVTPHLSAIVKIAQLLVLQRAVVAAEASETEYPAKMIDVMHDRFMVYGSRSPINWIQKLRTYGKKIRDTTTSLGYLIWSDNGEVLEYSRAREKRTAPENGSAPPRPKTPPTPRRRALQLQLETAQGPATVPRASTTPSRPQRGGRSGWGASQSALTEKRNSQHT